VHLKDQGHLVLQYGYDLPIPIADLQVDELGVIATLSFARAPQRTVVPWSAVYVVASDDGRGVLYPEDIPRDVAVIGAPGEGETAGDLNGPALRSTSDLPSPLGTDSRPTPTRALRAVPMGGIVEDDAIEILGNSGVDPTPARRRKRPQLRLVK
jgi:hypothetical protein